MNINEICDELIRRIPIYKKELNNHMKDYDGQILGFIFLVQVINLDLVNMLKIEEGLEEEITYINFSYNELINMLKEDKNLIKKYCDFIELMWLKGDDYIKEVLWIDILGDLSANRKVWKRFGTYISDNFKKYLNEEYSEEYSKWYGFVEKLN